MHFDAVIGETVTLAADTPEHPVEKGANIADHVKPELTRVRLDVFVSNSPVEDVAGRGASVQPTPTGLGNEVNVLRFPQLFDAVKDTVRDLEKLKDEGTLVDVVTHARYVASMAIQRVESRPKGDSAEITIEFKQLIIVSTKTVQAPKPKEPRGQTMQSKGAQQPQPKRKISFAAAGLDALTAYFSGGGA